MPQQIILATSDGMITIDETVNGRGISRGPVKTAIPASAGPTAAGTGGSSTGRFVQILKEKISTVLKLRSDQLDIHTPIADYGVDSILGLSLIKDLNAYLDTSIATTILFDYPTIHLLSAYLEAEYGHTIVTGQEQGAIITEAGGGIGKKLLLSAPGNIEDIRVKAFDPVAPGTGEVLVALQSAALNFGDLLCAKGLYPTMPAYPFTPGFEAAGIILETGDGVTMYKPGDEVIVIADSSLGMHASHVTVAAERLFAKPVGLSFAEACSLPVVSMTMVEVFRRVNLRPGETVLIQTATGGIGLAAVQLAISKGARIIATAGSAEKLDYLRSLGIADVINYQEQDFESEVKRLTAGRGVDAVVSSFSGENIQKGINCLGSRGRYAELSMTALRSGGKLDLSKFSNNQSFISIDLKRALEEDPAYARDLWEECLQLIRTGVLKSTINGEFGWDNYQEAYRMLENRGNIGKVVLHVEVRDGQKESVQGERGAVVRQQQPEGRPGDIAIVGISAQFGAASDTDEFWEMIREGKSMIEETPPERWSAAEHYSPDRNNRGKTYSKWGSFLKDIDKFDSWFFRISPREAETMDPQQRLFLEHSWKAIEDAAINPARLNASRCGVFAGATQGDYVRLLDANMDASVFWGNSSSVLASRISYHLNLKGPAVSIDTACSSSLVAMDLACKSLQLGETDLAISGGVSLFTSPEFYKQASRAGMLSPSGQCYSFDKRADGFVPGEGVGVVVLKRLADAVRDGDNIHGVIRGTLTNQDGTTNGITAPSIVSQRSLLTSIYEKTGINPGTIGYVEAHGTGTSLGDPIEFQALKEAFGHFTDKKGYCGLGSVKANIGHTLMAAGVAGVIKVLLCFKYRQLPPAVNYGEANPMIGLDDSPFSISTKPGSWEAEEGIPRRAAVSSFGFSGTNAHIILEEYHPAAEPAMKGAEPALVVLSARNEDRLAAQAANLEAYLRSRPGLSLHDIAYTLQTGREAMEARLAFIAGDIDQLRGQLSGYLRGESGQIQGKDSGSDLSVLASRWLSGESIDWALLYPAGGQRRISLPVYPFQRRSHWPGNQRQGRPSLPGREAVQHKEAVIAVTDKLVLLPIEAYEEPVNGVEAAGVTTITEAAPVKKRSMEVLRENLQRNK
jgi:polyketide synthase PksL